MVGAKLVHVAVRARVASEVRLKRNAEVTGVGIERNGRVARHVYNEQPVARRRCGLGVLNETIRPVRARRAPTHVVHAAKQPRTEVSRAVVIELGICRLAGTEVGLDPCELVPQQVVGAVPFHDA